MKSNPHTAVTEKQVYAEWMRLNQKKWRLDDNQKKSALKLLESMEGHEVEIIEIREQTGIHAVGFAFKEIIEEISEAIEELAMDSTCKFPF